MKKIYPLLLFLFFHSYFCFSQQPAEGNDDQRIDVIKMAYISQELNLSPQEAQNFWPVYNNYQNEIKQARSQYPNDEVAYEKRVVEIKQRYQPSFKKVLGDNGQRLNRVYTTDRKFHEMMRNELQKRQQQRQQQDFQQKPNQQQRPPKNMQNGDGQNRKINKINSGGGKPKHHRF